MGRKAPEFAEPIGRRVLSMAMDYELTPGLDQAKWDARVMADWVNYLAPWSVIAHLTFSWECSMDSGRRVFERFMARHLSRVSYFYALEENPSRDGFHVHALWADTGSVFRKAAWSEWFTRYGRARIEPVRRYEDVSGYCAKYVTKERAWWNVRLQWHRVQAMWKRPFTLDVEHPTMQPPPVNQNAS